MENLLLAEHLVKEFPVKGGVVHAVSDVSFAIRRGETLGLVGESGCGKSTLARLLMDLIPPTSGRVCFEGQYLDQLTGAARRQARQAMQPARLPARTWPPTPPLPPAPRRACRSRGPSSSRR